MKLESFQILNCFGFVDSGRVNLIDPHNFIYLLGRNSSGKSSFLTALKHLESGLIPRSQPNFDNFIKSSETPRLISEFSIAPGELSTDKLLKEVYRRISELDQFFNQDYVNADNAMKNAFEAILKTYEDLINKLGTSGKTVIEKLSDGSYRFLGSRESYQDYESRKQELSKLLNSAFRGGNNFQINRREFKFKLDFQEIENLLFLQFPRILLFTEAYSLTDTLPERITQENLKQPNSLLRAFISFLSEQAVKRLLDTKDPYTSDEILEKMQVKLNTLLKKVNQHRDKAEDKDAFLGMRLHEKQNGLQITVETNGKRSFYSHISNNTRFLFAYYLYKEMFNIQDDVLLFDEPNNGFHSTAQERLLDFLKSLAVEGNLVIVSTHSEHLIDADMLSGVRIMSADKNKNMVVNNHFYSQKPKGDYLALQPIIDAIGLKYRNQINIRDKVIITEGITDMLYLRAFKNILRHPVDPCFAPARGDSTIPNVLPFMISQGISFKIVIDTGKVKQQIQDAYGIEDKFFWEVPIPDKYKANKGSGIEDLFTENDFKKILARINSPIRSDYESLSNSAYMKKYGSKRIAAHSFYSCCSQFNENDFDADTIDNFRQVLDFCMNNNWFNI